MVHQAIELLKGVVMIVYPMKLPPHDPIRMELENIEDLSGTQASLDVIDPAIAQLWFCGRELIRDKKLSDYTGANAKCRAIVKLTKRGDGAPGREPLMTEDQRKKWMVEAYKRQEELKKLDLNDEDQYLDSDWADNSQLKKACQGMDKISWRPFKR